MKLSCLWIFAILTFLACVPNCTFAQPNGASTSNGKLLQVGREVPLVYRSFLNKSDSAVVVNFWFADTSGADTSEGHPKQGGHTIIKTAYIQSGDALSLVFEGVSKTNPLFFTVDATDASHGPKDSGGDTPIPPTIDAPSPSMPLAKDETVEPDRSCGVIGSFIESGTTEIQLPGRRIIQMFINRTDRPICISYNHRPKGEDEKNYLAPGGRVTRVFLNVTEEALICTSRPWEPTVGKTIDADGQYHVSQGVVYHDIIDTPSTPISEHGKSRRTKRSSGPSSGDVIEFSEDIERRENALALRETVSSVFWTDGITEIKQPDSQAKAGR